MGQTSSILKNHFHATNATTLRNARQLIDNNTHLVDGNIKPFKHYILEA